MSSTTAIKLEDATLLTQPGYAMSNWPISITFGELKMLARKKLGVRYIGINKVTHSTGVFIDVRRKKHTYHGVENVIEVQYKMPV